MKIIQAVLGDAEEKQLTDRAVKMWLDDLRDLAYDMEDILDEFATEALARKLKMEELDDDHQANTNKKVRKLLHGCVRNWSPRAIKFNRCMESEIKDVTSRLEGLCKHRADLGLREIAGGISSTVVYQRPPSTSLPTEPAVYGRDQDITKVMEMVLNDDEPSDANFCVIPIVGMGGNGKTTLAREVYNDNKAVRDFEPRAKILLRVAMSN